MMIGILRRTSIVIAVMMSLHCQKIWTTHANILPSSFGANIPPNSTAPPASPCWCSAAATRSNRTNCTCRCLQVVTTLEWNYDSRKLWTGAHPYISATVKSLSPSLSLTHWAVQPRIPPPGLWHPVRQAVYRTLPLMLVPLFLRFNDYYQLEPWRGYISVSSYPNFEDFDWWTD